MDPKGIFRLKLPSDSVILWLEQVTGLDYKFSIVVKQLTMHLRANMDNKSRKNRAHVGG